MNDEQLKQKESDTQRKIKMIKVQLEASGNTGDTIDLKAHYFNWVMETLEWTRERVRALLGDELNQHMFGRAKRAESELFSAQQENTKLKIKLKTALVVLKHRADKEDDVFDKLIEELERE